MRKKSVDKDSIPVTGFSVFATDTYKAAIIVKCDLGRLNLNLMPCNTPKIEIHKSYLKYVYLETK